MAGKSVLNMTPDELAELAKQVEEAKTAHEQQERELHIKLTERAVEMLSSKDGEFTVARVVPNEQGQTSLMSASFDDVLALARREHERDSEQARLKRQAAGRKAAATRQANSRNSGGVSPV